MGLIGEGEFHKLHHLHALDVKFCWSADLTLVC